MSNALQTFATGGYTLQKVAGIDPYNQEAVDWFQSCYSKKYIAGIIWKNQQDGYAKAEKVIWQASSSIPERDRIFPHFNWVLLNVLQGIHGNSWIVKATLHGYLRYVQRRGQPQGWPAGETAQMKLTVIFKVDLGIQKEFTHFYYWISRFVLCDETTLYTRCPRCQIPVHELDIEGKKNCCKLFLEPPSPTTGMAPWSPFLADLDRRMRCPGGCTDI